MKCVQWMILLLTMSLLQVEAEELSKKERLQLLKSHNEHRKRAFNGSIDQQPLPKYMPSLEWDTGLAVKARTHAKRCLDEHDTLEARQVGRFQFVGQNIYSSTSGPTDPVVKWFEEHHNYDYESNTCRGSCEHYTQLVWAATTHVGCARVICGKGWYHYVCNYAPAGNIRGEHPYIWAGTGIRRRLPSHHSNKATVMKAFVDARLYAIGLIFIYRLSGL